MVSTVILFNILSLVMTGIYCRYAGLWGFIDKPNGRSSHQMPTPRGGGIVFISLWLCFYFYLLLSSPPLPEQRLLELLAIILVFVVSLYDDWAGLSAKTRIVVHVLSAVMVSLSYWQSFNSGGDLMALIYGCFMGAILVFVLTWSINLYNFMDGLDGLAALQAIVSLSVGGWMFYAKGGEFYSQLCWVLSSVLVGFIYWNRPKARLFMGDSGSATLGLILCVMALKAFFYYQISLLLWIMLLMGFILDASLTLIRRMLSGQRWYEAHDQHAYQRLYQFGWSHKDVLRGFLGLNVFASLLVILAFKYPAFELTLFIVEMISFLAIYYFIGRLNPMNKSHDVRLIQE